MLMPSIFGESLIDDIFDYPKNSFSFRTSNANGLMKTDIKDKKDAFELTIAIPGANKEDITAELSDGYLNISATTKQEKNEGDEEDRYIRRERYYGTCSRSFYVGEDVTQDDIKAKYENGILTVDVPKIEKQPEVPEKKLIAIEG